MAGQGYGPHVLPLLFDLINGTNDVSVPDSSHKKISKSDELASDPDGSKTIEYLTNARAMVWRLCSTHASSLGLHPALYFYSPSGIFQPGAILTFVTLFKGWDTPDFRKFIAVRSKFEEFLLANRGITEAVRKLGSGSRSRPRILALYRKIISDIDAGASVAKIKANLAKEQDFAFLVAESPSNIGAKGAKFKKETKSGAFLRDALPGTPKCPTCGGLTHRNGMQAGHKQHRRLGGNDSVGNAQMQHPFCNSTVDQ